METWKFEREKKQGNNITVWKVSVFVVILVCIFPEFFCVRSEYGYLSVRSVFSPNVGKCGKNADQNNSEYGYFLHSDILRLKLDRQNVTPRLIKKCFSFSTSWFLHLQSTSILEKSKLRVGPQQISPSNFSNHFCQNKCTIG